VADVPVGPANPEGNTEPVMLPVDAPPVGPTGTEADEGLVPPGEIEDMVKTKVRPPKAPTPPVPPAKPPTPPEVTHKDGSPFWLWLTFGLVAVGITVGVWAVLRTRRASGASSSEGRIPRREAAAGDPPSGA
jgi:hypothetical protein